MRACRCHVILRDRGLTARLWTGHKRHLSTREVVPERRALCMTLRGNRIRARGLGHNWSALLVVRSCMGVVDVLNERRMTAFAAGALLLSSLALCGCATSTSSSLMDARAEEPTSAPSAYLPVEVRPPKRAAPVLTADERLKLQKELLAARDRQVSKANARLRAMKP
jgi:hypothetical protein